MVNLSEFMDGAFAGPDGSADDVRFGFSVGEHVLVDGKWRGQIVSRRNGYPPPFFHGYWFPIYFIEPFAGEPSPYRGEDVGPARLRRLNS